MSDDETMKHQIQMLTDRQQIYDCLVRYCRGIDRLDRELLLSAYHPDAIDDHGFFVGNPEEFADFFFSFHRDNQHGTSHIISNHYVELEGDIAHCETYWTYAGMNAYEPELTMMGGRYVDRMERRAGGWGIASRKCLVDWWGEPGDTGLTPEVMEMLKGAGTVGRDRNDSSYQRPLAIPRERQENPPQNQS
ncbi:MAG: nuclear transport factor 2 family protein [Halieaceae bacterium]|jgi:hypothetical protein|nr:nuclear transport factor 2 family protein [Halieaceae bacterium]